MRDERGKRKKKKKESDTRSIFFSLAWLYCWGTTQRYHKETEECCIKWYYWPADPSFRRSEVIGVDIHVKCHTSSGSCIHRRVMNIFFISTTDKREESRVCLFDHIARLTERPAWHWHCVNNEHSSLFIQFFSQL